MLFCDTLLNLIYTVPRVRWVWTSSCNYAITVVPTAIYASETWKSTGKVLKKLDVFQQRNLRKITKVTWNDKVTNTEVLTRSGQKRLHDTVEERIFRFAGHVILMATERRANHAIDWTRADGKRIRDRPRKTWRSRFQEDLHARGVSLGEMKMIAADRVRWRKLYCACSAKGRRNYV